MTGDPYNGLGPCQQGFCLEVRGMVCLDPRHRPSAGQEAREPAHPHGHRPEDCDHYDASHGSVCDLCCPSCNGEAREPGRSS